MRRREGKRERVRDRDRDRLTDTERESERENQAKWQAFILFIVVAFNSRLTEFRFPISILFSLSEILN